MQISRPLCNSNSSPSLPPHKFNPTSLPQSTQCTTNLIYAVILYGVSVENLVLVAIATSLASYSSLFPVMVLVPVLLHHRDKALAGKARRCFERNIRIIDRRTRWSIRRAVKNLTRTTPYQSHKISKKAYSFTFLH